MKKFLTVFFIMSVLVMPEISKANDELIFQEERKNDVSYDQSFWQRIVTKKPSNTIIATKDLNGGTVQCVNNCFDYFGDTIQARNCAALCHVLWF